MTIRTVKDGEPRTATSTFSQFLSSESPVRESVLGQNNDYGVQDDQRRLWICGSCGVGWESIITGEMPTWPWQITNLAIDHVEHRRRRTHRNVIYLPLLPPCARRCLSTFFLLFFFFSFLDHHEMNNILQAVKTLTALVSNLILILLQAKEK